MNEKSVSTNYIASQTTREGLDELQRLVLAHHLSQHTALSGPPSAGKTLAVETLVEITGLPFFDIPCAEEMSEGPIIGYPAFEREGSATVTRYKKGLETIAMEEGGIFYANEVNLLRRKVQKRCFVSSTDHRRMVRMRDGTKIQAPYDNGFMVIIDYNPTDKGDLDEAVADRFVHLNFNYLPPDIEAAAALARSRELEAMQPTTTMETRGIVYDHKGRVLHFLKKDKGRWKNQFTGDNVRVDKDVYVYQALSPQRTASYVDAKTYHDLALVLANFFVTVRNFSDNGTTRLDTDLLNYLQGIGQANRVSLHKPGARILSTAISQYVALQNLGMEQKAAMSYVVNTVIDQVCYGRFGTKLLGSGPTGGGIITVRDAVVVIAQKHGLLERVTHATSLAPSTP